MVKKRKKLLFLIGPTASGKSEAAIILAKKNNSEIISCDSMQVYRKMDILTSKVGKPKRKEVKHHLIDIIRPQDEYDVAKYRKDALAVCDRIFLKNKSPLFVGGTGLYYSIIVDGLFAAVPQDRRIRAKLNKQLKAKGSAYLYKRLVKADPIAAAKIHPHDTRRIIRALEVYLKTGKKISLLQKSRVGLGREYTLKILGLSLDRAVLYDKINQRVDKMFRLGAVSEVRQLLKQKLSKTAACAIGVNEIKGYLTGRYSLEHAKYLIQRNSRHYAKRQLTWFRKDKRIQWVKIKKTDSPRQIALKLWKKLS